MYALYIHQARSQKIFLGSALEEKVDFLILYIMYHSPGEVEELGCMLMAYIHEGLYLYF